jgi:hypothetical protein
LLHPIRKDIQWDTNFGRFVCDDHTGVHNYGGSIYGFMCDVIRESQGVCIHLHH